MSIGDNNTANVIEKFSTVCSLCKKDTMVPFKPEAGRAVYCKDCISKIKSGELKPIKGSIRQIKEDESKFFKPLADLGIEFESKNNDKETERYPERIDKLGHEDVDKKIIYKNISVTTPKIFSTIKKVFTKTNPVQKENLALKEILNKTLSENKILYNKQKEIKVKNIEEVKKIESTISLDELKKEKPKFKVKSNDRSASIEEMNKLKDFISEKIVSIKDKNSIPTLASETLQIPVIKSEKKEESTQKIDSINKIKEVPEDVLRKILE